MIITKLVLFASPIFVASMLFLANPVAAFNVDSASEQIHVNATSVQSVHHVIALNKADKSNPILDALACKCATCTQAKLQLEGKLSISDIL